MNPLAAFGTWTMSFAVTNTYNTAMKMVSESDGNYFMVSAERFLSSLSRSAGSVLLSNIVFSTSMLGSQVCYTSMQE